MVAGVWTAYYVARNKNGTLCVGVAKSTSGSIIGPYVDPIGKPLVYTPGMGNIDPTFFRDTDGSQYVAYQQDGNGQTPQQPTPIWLVSVHADGTAITSDKTMLITNDQPWEGTLVEAPWFVREPNSGYYYLFYSGNWSHWYSLGVARSKSVAGPYTKYPSPLVHTNDTFVPFQGSGHCSVIINPATGGMAMLYHSWRPDANGPRYVMMDAVHWTSDSPPWPYVFDGSGFPSTTEQPVP